MNKIRLCVAVDAIQIPLSLVSSVDIKGTIATGENYIENYIKLIIPEWNSD